MASDHVCVSGPSHVPAATTQLPTYEAATMPSNRPWAASPMTTIASTTTAQTTMNAGNSLADAAVIELLQVDRPRGRPLLQEQRRDQEAGQYKEKGNAHGSCGEAIGQHVTGQHKAHGQAARAVKTRTVSQAPALAAVIRSLPNPPPLDSRRGHCGRPRDY